MKIFFPNCESVGERTNVILSVQTLTNKVSKLAYKFFC